MSQEKREALELIQRLPDDVTTTDIMEALYFKMQVEKGLRDTMEGRTITHQELEGRLMRWRKSVGH